MGKLKTIKSNKADCGITAIKMILDSYGLDYDTYDDILYGNGISYFGELLNSEQVNRALSAIARTIQFEMVEFKAEEELKNIITAGVKNQKYILISYYAFQGFLCKDTRAKIDMKHAHWGVIYEIEDELITGKQSNVKADILGCLKDKEVADLYKANQILNRVKVDFGKYNKCNISIFKRDLGKVARCGSGQICSLCSSMKSDECVYDCNLGGKVWLINSIEEKVID